MYSKNLREQLPALATQMNAIVAKAKQENDRGLTSAERESFHKLEEDYSGIEDSIKIAEKTTTVTDELAKAKDEGKVVEFVADTFGAKKPKSAYDKAFSNYLKMGERASREDTAILNTMSTTTGSQGGYAVPTSMQATIETAMKWYCPIDNYAQKIVTSTGNALQWPTVSDVTQMGRFIGQNVQLVENDLTFGQITFNSYIAVSDLLLVPWALLEDAVIDLEAYIGEQIGVRLGRLRSNACTVGTGTNMPTGVVTAAIANGNVVTASTGGTTAITYNNLVDLEHAVDPAYRNNPKTIFMFSDTVLKTLKKLVDSANRPLWLPAISASFQQGAGVDPSAFRPEVLSHPYAINNDVAVPAANAYTICFGDFNKFAIREVKSDSGVRIVALRERYADYLSTGYFADQRYDSNILDGGTHPIAVFRQSAT